jgi:hypothetical protein
MPLINIQNRVVGIHAFIAGVSDYTYLPGEDDPPPEGNRLGMKKLNMAALSAYRFARWLRDSDESGALATPLASCEVMLAPTPVEEAVAGVADYKDDLTTDHFVERMRAWRERVAGDKTNMAVFYFAGHGIQRSRDDSLLMLKDFGKSQQAILEKSVAFQEIFQGMAPSDDYYPNMALTHLYFVDTCRNLPEILRGFVNLRTAVVFDQYLGGRDDRRAPIYFATVSGGFSYGQPGIGSYFSTALLNGLSSGAERKDDDINGKSVCPVTVYTLATAMSFEFKKLKTDQVIVPLLSRDFPICYLDKPPPVDINISVMPAERRNNAKLQLTQIDGDFVWTQPAPAPQHPYALSPPMGIHQLSAVVNGSPNPIDIGRPRFINQQSRLWSAQLP